MKIVQVVEYGDALVGLADDGQLYHLSHKDLGFGLIKPTWELYCTEYGPALTQPVIEQVTSYITSHCYTSTKISDKLKERYGNGAMVVEQTENSIKMLSNDQRIALSVERTEVKIGEEVFNGLKIITTTLHGDMHVQFVVNKTGGTYVRV